MKRMCLFTMIGLLLAMALTSGCADTRPSVAVIQPTYSLFRDGPPPVQITGEVPPIKTHEPVDE